MDCWNADCCFDPNKINLMVSIEMEQHSITSFNDFLKHIKKLKQHFNIPFNLNGCCKIELVKYSPRTNWIVLSPFFTRVLFTSNLFLCSGYNSAQAKHNLISTASSDVL